MPHGSWAGSYPGATPLRSRARRVWRTLEAADYRPPPLVTGAAESGKIITSGKPGPVRSVSRVPVVQALQEFVSCELDFLVALCGRLAAREQGQGDGRASATAAR